MAPQQTPTILERDRHWRRGQTMETLREFFDHIIRNTPREKGFLRIRAGSFLSWVSRAALSAPDSQNDAPAITEEDRRYQEIDKKLKALAKEMKKEWNETLSHRAA